MIAPSTGFRGRSPPWLRNGCSFVRPSALSWPLVHARGTPSYTGEYARDPRPLSRPSRLSGAARRFVMRLEADHQRQRHRHGCVSSCRGGLCRHGRAVLLDACERQVWRREGVELATESPRTRPQQMFKSCSATNAVEPTASPASVLQRPTHRLNLCFVAGCGTKQGSMARDRHSTRVLRRRVGRKSAGRCAKHEDDKALAHAFADFSRDAFHTLASC